MKKGIQYEVNSILHGKGYDKRIATFKVKVLHAMKFGGQEVGNNS